MNESSQQKIRKLYLKPKPIVKMKPNKLLAAWIITSVHAIRGRVVKLKSTQYQLDDDILKKRKFDSHIWKQCIQANAIRHKHFYKNKSPREKDAMPPHFVTIEHPSKSGKLNGVSKIFPYLFDLISIFISLLSTLWLMIVRLLSLFKLMSLRNVESLIVWSWN